MSQKLDLAKILPYGARTAIARRLGVDSSLITRRLAGHRRWPLRDAVAVIEILRNDYSLDCSVEDLLAEELPEQAAETAECAGAAAVGVRHAG